jgi:DNA-binding transcriptional LysR family regulator
MATQAEMGDLELVLLRTFLAVVDEGSIGKAAASVDMTQSAVSQQMFRLEKIVGQKLFARERNGITLTHHGKLLVPYANRALELNNETLMRLREETTPSKLAMGISTDVALTGIIPALKRMQSIYPELEFKFLVTDAGKLDKLLKMRELDLVINNPNLMTGTPKATWRVPLHWAAAKELQVEKLRPLRLVLLEGAFSWQDEMLESLRAAGWTWRISFESSSFDAILTATHSGLGLAVLPMDAIQRGKLVAVTDTGLPPAPQIEFGMFSAAALPNHAQNLLEVAMASLPISERHC